MRQITVGKNDAGQRLDKFLTKTYTKLPQSMLYKGIRTKNIKLNGKRCQISSRIQEGDIISLYLKEEFFEQTPTEYDFLKAPKVVDCVYEDENILLLNKNDQAFWFILMRTIILILSLLECSIIFMKRASTSPRMKIPLLPHW